MFVKLNLHCAFVPNSPFCTIWVTIGAVVAVRHLTKNLCNTSSVPSRKKVYFYRRLIWRICWSLFKSWCGLFSLVALVTERFDRWPDQPVTSSAAGIWAIWKWLCEHDAGTQPFYSIKSMSKPSPCFPADKVIAVDLWAMWMTIMNSVCTHTMNVEQCVCLFSQKKMDK